MVDHNRKKVIIVKLPKTFFAIQREKGVQRVFQNVGLEEYFKLPAWGVDYQRSYELMTTLDVDNVAKITNMDGQKSRVHIDEELIANALQLKTGYFNLTDKISDRDKNTTFLTLPGMAYTYKDLVHKDSYPILFCNY